MAEATVWISTSHSKHMAIWDSSAKRMHFGCWRPLPANPKRGEPGRYEALPFQQAILLVNQVKAGVLLWQYCGEQNCKVAYVIKVV